MENIPTIKDLLEAGVHFGHQTKRWNPKMSRYIFTKKNDIHIIDLEKTQAMLADALNFVEEQVAQGGSVLFVGTKRQAQEVVEEVAQKAGVYHVTNRWVGGLLTNFNITKQNLNKMAEIEDGMSKGFENRTKQEISLLAKELERLQRLYGGIKGLNRKPAVIILADPHHERIVVHEARKLGVPVVAVVDTNCDPDEVDYVIPGNDDAIGAINLFFNLFAQAVERGREKAKARAEAKAKETPKEAAKPVVKPAPKKETKEAAVQTKAAEPKEAKKEAPKAKKAPAKVNSTTAKTKKTTK